MNCEGCDPVLRDCLGAPEAAIVTARVPRATASELPPELTQILTPDVARVHLRRGLRNGSEYFCSAPPRVIYDHPTVAITSLILDGVELSRKIARREEFTLPFDLSPATHRIEILGVEKKFTLTEAAVASQMDPYDCRGYEVCQARGVALPVKSPGSSQSGDYNDANVIIVVGGLLL